MYDPDHLAVILADTRATRDQLLEITNNGYADGSPIAIALNAAMVLIGSGIIHLLDAVEAAEKLAAPASEDAAAPRVITGEPMRRVMRGERI